jgi:hypothetical protein
MQAGLLLFFVEILTMKIKLNRNQWEDIGKETGWIKEAQDMNQRMDAFFSPSITLKRHNINGHVITGYWYADLVKDFKLVQQIIKENGIKARNSAIPDSELDAFEMAAGKYGYSIETIGE